MKHEAQNVTIEYMIRRIALLESAASECREIFQETAVVNVNGLAGALQTLANTYKELVDGLRADGAALCMPTPRPSPAPTGVGMCIASEDAAMHTPTPRPR